MIFIGLPCVGVFLDEFLSARLNENVKHKDLLWDTKTLWKFT